MSINYGIGVRNRYALFMGDEDTDSLDFIAKSRVEAAVAANAVDARSSAKKLGAKKSTTAVAVETKAGAKDALNGGVPNAAKTKQSQVASHKAAANATGVQKGGHRETNATSAPQANHATGVGKRGGENRSSNRPPRQEKFGKPPTQNSSASAFGSSPSQENNTWSQTGSGFGASRDQKDIEERKNRRNLGSNYLSESRDKNDDSSRGRAGRGGRGGFRNRGRGRGGSFDNRGKREYDRQSGSDKTGVKPMEKRDGSGAHNWGTFADELDAQMNPNTDETNEWNEKSDETAFETNVVKEDGVVAEEDDKAKETEGENVEEEPKEMTLQEWKKLEEEKRAKPSFNLRKPGEGEDNAQWKKTYVLKKKKEEEDEDEYEEVEVEEEIRHGRQKRILDIEINFKDEMRDTRRGRGRGSGRGTGRGGRGGREGRDGGREAGDRPERGGGGGRRGGGSFRGRDPKEQSTPKMDDWNDFPSLLAA